MASYPGALPSVAPAADFAGFVETDRHIAIEAPHFQRAINDRETMWRTLPDFGRTLGGVTAFLVTAAPRQPGGDSPRLEYDVHLFSAGEITVELHCAPSLDFQSGDGVRRVATRHKIAAPGPHVFKFWLVTLGVVLERIVIDAGGVRPSYLGPPESPRASARVAVQRD